MKIIVCGSMTFAREMKDAKEFLDRKGHQVTVPPLVEDFISGKLSKSVGEHYRIKKPTT